MNRMWNQILVSRDAFLLESLAPYVDDAILERLQSVSPAQAGVDPRVIARISARIIDAHASRAAAIALPSALAAGIMRAFTLPLEYASYLYESILLVQKLLYLHTSIKEEHLLAHHQLQGYLCIFFGVSLTAKGISSLTALMTRAALRHFLKKRLLTLIPLASGTVSAAMTKLSMKQLAEDLIAQLKARQIEHHEYLTIGCAPTDIATPLFHLDADEVAR